MKVNCRLITLVLCFVYTLNYLCLVLKHIYIYGNICLPLFEEIKDLFLSVLQKINCARHPVEYEKVFAVV